MKLFLYILLLICLYPALSDEQIDYPDSLNKPLMNHGRTFLIESDNYKTINKQDIVPDNYISFDEILFENLNIYPLHLGEAGADNNYSIFGASPNSNAFSFNNSPLFNHRSRNYTPNRFPTENFENAEIYVGSNAVILSDNSNGSYINFQEIIHNSAKPYTKFWYGQESDLGIFVDGIYSQNFMKNINLTLGFRNMGSQGNYPNSSSESWNFRSSLKWFATDFSMLSLTFNHLNFGNELNGGIVDSLSEDNFSPIDAYVRYNNLDKKEFQNSTSLTYSTYLDTSKNSAFSATLDFSMNKYMIYSGDDFYFFPADSTNKLTDIVPDFKFSSKYEQKLKSIIMRVGGNINLFDIKSHYLNTVALFNNFATFAMVDIPFASAINLTGGARYSNYYNRNTLSVGSRLTFKNDNHRAFADVSFSEYIPDFFQNPDLAKEKHSLFLLNYDYFGGSTFIETNLFYRNIASPLISVFESPGYSNKLTHSSKDVNIIGFWLKYKTEPIDNYHMKVSSLNYLNLDDNKQKLPHFLISMKFYYEYILKRSFLRAGINFSIMGKHSYSGYNPVTSLYYNQNNTSVLSINGLDAFVSMRLGRAYVKAAMYNALGTGYYYVYLYPVKQQNLRLTISWSFFD